MDGLDDEEDVEERRRERRRRRRQRLTACCKSAVAFLFSHIGLAAMVVAYSILGGFLFRAIEAPAEESTKLWVRAARKRGVDDLERLVVTLCDCRHRRRSPTFPAVPDEPETTVAYAAEIGAVLLRFQKQVLLAVQQGWDGNDYVTESKLQWSFAGALLYAVTVITTIGIINTSVGAGSGAVRIDPLRFLAGCRIRRLNQALSVLSISLDFLSVSVVLLTRDPFALCYLVLFVCSVSWLFLLKVKGKGKGAYT